MAKEEKKSELDNPIAVFLLFIIAAVLLYLFQYFKPYLLVPWYYIKLSSFYLIDLIPKEIFTYLYSWVFWEKNYTNIVYSIKDVFIDLNYNNFMDQDFMNQYLMKYNILYDPFIAITNKIIFYFHLPFFILFATIASIKIIKKERFSKVYNINSLAIQESKIWPTIRPIIYHYDDFVSAKSHTDDVWFRMADKPEEYFFKNNFIDEFISKEFNNIENYNEKFFKLNQENIYNHYSKELGNPFVGFKDMPYYKRGIIAIFTLMVVSGKDEVVREIINSLAIMHSSYPNVNLIKTLKSSFLSFDIKKSVFLILGHYKNLKTKNRILKEMKEAEKKAFYLINKVLKEYYDFDENNKKSFFSFSAKKEKKEFVYHPKIKKILDTHYYENTLIYALIVKGRNISGVAAACEFIWIKKIDRHFFYLISQTGRKSSFCNVAGTVAHYLSETKFNFKVISPNIYNSIKAVDKYMSKNFDKYIPISTKY